MKAIGQLKILSCQPFILISHEDLRAIQYIVDIAPKEAQWFHRLEKIEEFNGGRATAYRIYEMYIPEQNVSGTEVESEPEMMIKFYKELRDKHGQEEANEIFSSMTTWCHSHHNMSPNPSGQDRKQFEEQCEEAQKQGVTSPQLMMILNKKNEYYSKLWDPEKNMLVENIPMIVGSYDFAWIKDEAKEKFKEKKIARTIMGNRGVIDWSKTGWANGNTSPTKIQASKGKPKKNKVQRSLQTTHGDQKAKIEYILSHKEQILELLVKINSKNNPKDETISLIKLLNSVLNPVELVILNTLLNGSDDDIWDLEDNIPIVIAKNMEEAQVSLYELLIDSVVDESVFWTAIEFSTALARASDAETAEKILDIWISIYEESIVGTFEDIFTDDSVLDTIMKEGKDAFSKLP